jgi:hypothetical protein
MRSFSWCVEPMSPHLLGVRHVVVLRVALEALEADRERSASSRIAAASLILRAMMDALADESLAAAPTRRPVDVPGSCGADRLVVQLLHLVE